MNTPDFLDSESGLALPGLEVRNIDPISGGAAKLRATFDLYIEGLGTLKRCRFLRNTDGRPFVHGPSVRDQSGVWISTFEFDRRILKRIAALVQADPRASNL